MTDGQAPALAVLGAINVDLVVTGASLPGRGETVTGGTFARHHGGKGGNQAVAAARWLARSGSGPGSTDEARSSVWMMGAVGEDELGVSALQALRADEVVVDHVLVTGEAPTGVALIAVDAQGENQISVAPGANLELTPQHVVEALGTLLPHVVLASLEVAERTVTAALDWCRDHAVTTILNPAPFHPWARSLVPSATYLTPNEQELERLGELSDATVVIETRGQAGVRIHAGGEATEVLAPHVPVVDTTGAGDCFNGVFAASLALAAPLEEAVRQAVVASALSVGEAGAREGMPSASEVSAARERWGI